MEEADIGKTCVQLRDIKKQNILNNNRCGAALQKLLDTPEIIHYLYGTPFKDLLCYKDIYQHGALRKVTHLITVIYMYM